MVVFSQFLKCFMFLVGDGKKAEDYASGMEIWDTVNKDLTAADLPNIPGFTSGTSSLYRPVVSSLDENSFILIASAIYDNEEKKSGNLDQIYQYSADRGVWVTEGKIKGITPENNEYLEEFGVYLVKNNANSKTVTILSGDKCMS